MNDHERSISLTLAAISIAGRLLWMLMHATPAHAQPFGYYGYGPAFGTSTVVIDRVQPGATQNPSWSHELWVEQMKRARCGSVARLVHPEQDPRRCEERLEQVIR